MKADAENLFTHYEEGMQTHTLPIEDRADIQRLIDELGEAKTLAALNVSREALARALAGLSVRRGTLALIRAGLAEKAKGPPVSR